MSAEELRRKAQRRERKSRFEAAYSIIIGLILFGWFAWGSARTHELAPRIGYAVLSFYSIYFAYMAGKRIRRERLKPDATLNTTLESYRKELEKRHDHALYIWPMALTFCFVGMALVMVPPLIQSFHTPRLLLNFVPLFVLFATWCTIYLIIRKRMQRKVQKDLAELRAFERENRS